MSQAFAEIVSSRRTTKKFNGQGIELDKLKLLLDWAIMAPNHRMNEPWAFRILSAERIKDLVERLKPEPDLEKGLERLESLGALIFVSVERSEIPAVDLENYAATCAATQNILLGAEALGIQSYWSTGKLMKHPLTLSFVGMPESERLVAGIYLGYGSKPAAPKRKRSPERIHWV